jgi:hypothetical protein
MRTFNVLLVVAGSALIATCSSSLSTPSDGGSGGQGGQIATGGSSGATALGGSNGTSGTGGRLASGGTGGTLPLCGAGGAKGLGGFGGFGGTSGLDATVDANCAPNPLAGCPGPAAAPCGPGTVCAYSSQNGVIELNTCMAVPSGCDSCSCLEEALYTFARQFPNVSVAAGACNCSDSQHQQVDGGTPANPIIHVGCNGA